MGGVLSTDQELAGTCAETGSMSHSHSQFKPLCRHPTGKSPTFSTGSRIKTNYHATTICPGAHTQTWTDEGSLPLPLVESPEEPGLGSSTAVPHPFHPETGIGNRNPYDVTRNVGRGQSAYSGAHLTCGAGKLQCEPTCGAKSCSSVIQFEQQGTNQALVSKRRTEAHFASQGRSQSEEPESYRSPTDKTGQPTYEPSSTTDSSHD